jgi:hypothetical protein
VEKPEKMRPRYSSKAEIAAPICVSLEVEGESQPATGWIVRMSVAGVDIETLHTPAVGSKVAFHAALDPESPEIHEFTGRVQWVTGARVGIQFAELGAKQTYAIVEATRGAAAGPPSQMPPSERQAPSSKRFGGLHVLDAASANAAGGTAEENEITVTFEELIPLR